MGLILSGISVSGRTLAGSALVVTDEYYPNVSLSLTAPGSNGGTNNSFVDGSSNNLTITRNGNVTQGTYTPYGQNGWSGNFLSAGDYLYATNCTTQTAFGTGDFTVECWINLTGTSGVIAGNYVTSGSDLQWIFSVNATGIAFTGRFTSYLQGTTPVPLGQWCHVAVSRQSGTLRAFVNGVLSGSSVTASNQSATNTCWIAGGGSIAGSFQGLISNLRIVKGTAVYTANFTPSVAPLTAITNTVLLTLQDSRFKDNSANAFPIALTGTPKIQPASPFIPAVSYSTSVNGGGAYFDGAGDYLSAASTSAFNFGTGDFTVECWTYMTAAKSSGNAGYIFDFRFGGGATTILWLEAGTAYGVYVAGSTVAAPIASSSYLNTWTHWAVVRQSGTVKVYINGTQNSTFAAAGSQGNSGLTVGSRFNATEFFPGYISNFRVVNGTAVYTSNFTVPAAPVTAISGTSILLNATNASIIDVTGKATLETKGTAQVSTSIIKYGPGTVSLPGNSTSYASAPYNDIYNFGGGNFTIECWLNITSIPDLAVIPVGFWPTSGSTGWLLYVTPSGLTFYINGSTALITAASPTWSTGSWYHIAITRSGSTWTAWVNGTSVGTATSSAVIGNNSTTTPLAIGINAASARNYLNGYIEDLRITRGIARYTSSFTPPTGVFPTR